MNSWAPGLWPQPWEQHAVCSTTWTRLKHFFSFIFPTNESQPWIVAITRPRLTKNHFQLGFSINKKHLEKIDWRPVSIRSPALKGLSTSSIPPEIQTILPGTALPSDPSSTQAEPKRRKSTVFKGDFQRMFEIKGSWRDPNSVWNAHTHNEQPRPRVPGVGSYLKHTNFNSTCLALHHMSTPPIPAPFQPHACATSNQNLHFAKHFNEPLLRNVIHCFVKTRSLMCFCRFWKTCCLFVLFGFQHHCKAYRFLIQTLSVWGVWLFPVRLRGWFEEICDLKYVMSKKILRFSRICKLKSKGPKRGTPHRPCWKGSGRTCVYDLPRFFLSASFALGFHLHVLQLSKRRTAEGGAYLFTGITNSWFVLWSLSQNMETVNWEVFPRRGWFWKSRYDLAQKTFWKAEEKTQQKPLQTGRNT